jgi:hypothetical protein
MFVAANHALPFVTCTQCASRIRSSWRSSTCAASTATPRSRRSATRRWSSAWPTWTPSGTSTARRLTGTVVLLLLFMIAGYISCAIPRTTRATCCSASTHGQRTHSQQARRRRNRLEPVQAHVQGKPHQVRHGRDIRAAPRYRHCVLCAWPLVQEGRARRLARGGGAGV